jgi:hypothetical protein
MIRAEDPAQRAEVEAPGHICVWAVEALASKASMAARNEYLGWGPYQPMLRADRTLVSRAPWTALRRAQILLGSGREITPVHDASHSLAAPPRPSRCGTRMITGPMSQRTVPRLQAGSPHTSFLTRSGAMTTPERDAMGTREDRFAPISGLGGTLRQRPWKPTVS